MVGGGHTSYCKHFHSHWEQEFSILAGYFNPYKLYPAAQTSMNWGGGVGLGDVRHTSYGIGPPILLGSDTDPLTLFTDTTDQGLRGRVMGCKTHIIWYRSTNTVRVGYRSLNTIYRHH